MIFENNGVNPCFNCCDSKVGNPCSNLCDSCVRERDYYIYNSDMYYKLKMMKEDMELSIKIHKLRKEHKNGVKLRGSFA